jgi:hypothetical protein
VCAHELRERLERFRRRRFGATAHAEEALCDDEIHEYHEVHEQRADPHECHAVEELVDLDRKEAGGGQNGQVLGPPPLAPQPAGLEGRDDAIDAGEKRQDQ